MNLEQFQDLARQGYNRIPVYREILADLEYRTSWIATIVKSAPMLGLLGTVIGMISAFQDIAAMKQTGMDPSALAAPIVWLRADPTTLPWTWLQYVLLGPDVAPAAKAVFVFVGTVALSWAGTTVLRRIPRVATVI